MEIDRARTVAGLISEMQAIQRDFLERYDVNDIWSNSKIYEVLQANTLGHRMIPGHSGSLDASDSHGREYEYKHFKETSSNHSWTFNDYSDQTIEKLATQVHAVVFAHINDLIYPPEMDWSFEATGSEVAGYLSTYTVGMTNARRMINISPKQLEERLRLRRRNHATPLDSGPYGEDLKNIFRIISALEKAVQVSNILTSNKFWEVLVSIPLGHTVNSEQGGRSGAHDAFDDNGGDYEYKVSSSKSWNFQDISPTVLRKYLNCEEIVLAIVNKTQLRVESIWTAKPENVVARLSEKLEIKKSDYAKRGRELRRIQVSLSAGDLQKIRAQQVY